MKKEGLNGLEGLLAAVGLEVTTECIRTGTGTERWRERFPNFRGCNADVANDVRTFGLLHIIGL